MHPRTRPRGRPPTLCLCLHGGRRGAERGGEHADSSAEQQTTVVPELGRQLAPPPVPSPGARVASVAWRGRGTADGLHWPRLVTSAPSSPPGPHGATENARSGAACRPLCAPSGRHPLQHRNAQTTNNVVPKPQDERQMPWQQGDREHRGTVLSHWSWWRPVRFLGSPVPYFC